MKCDKLHPASLFEFEKVLKGKSNKLFYAKADVDAAIAELKDELNQYKAREDVLCTDNRDLLEKTKTLEDRLLENADHFKRNEAQIIEASDKLKAENERLNRELEHVKNGDCINTCDVVEKHVKEELKAKRALWMARATKAFYLIKIIDTHAYTEILHLTSKGRDERGKPIGIARTAMEWYDLFKEVLRKCTKKAEEYK